MLGSITQRLDGDLIASNIASGVEIFGITGTYTGAGCADPNLLPGNILSGVTILGVTGTFACPTDPDLIPSNIVSGVDILGVLGTFTCPVCPPTGVTQTYFNSTIYGVGEHIVTGTCYTMGSAYVANVGTKIYHIGMLSDGFSYGPGVREFDAATNTFGPFTFLGGLMFAPNSDNISTVIPQLNGTDIIFVHHRQSSGFVELYGSATYNTLTNTFSGRSPTGFGLGYGLIINNTSGTIGTGLVANMVATPVNPFPGTVLTNSVVHSGYTYSTLLTNNNCVGSIYGARV